MASISESQSKRVKMDSISSTTRVVLIDNTTLTMSFKRDNSSTLNSRRMQPEGNNGITSVSTSEEENPILKVKVTDLLTIQVMDDEDKYLRNMLRKTLGNRSESTSDCVELSWKLAFVSDKSATMKLVVGGDFFEEFLRNYEDSVRVRTRMGILFKDQMIFTISSKEMSPAVFVGTTAKGKPMTVAFEDELKLEVEKPMRTDRRPHDCNIIIEMLITRQMGLKHLPCGTTMGRNILEKKLRSDFEIIADDDTRFPCHEAFLAGCSEALAGMLEMECKETKEKAIKFKMSGKGVGALLKFIYYENVDDPMSSCSVAFELLEIGNQYDILGLKKSMKDILLGKQYSWFDIDTAILLYFWTFKVEGNEDLKWKALRVIKSKGNDLEGSTMFEKLLKEDTKTATKLIAQSFNI